MGFNAFSHYVSDSQFYPHAFVQSLIWMHSTIKKFVCWDDLCEQFRRIHDWHAKVHLVRCGTRLFWPMIWSRLIIWHSSPRPNVPSSLINTQNSMFPPTSFSCHYHRGHPNEPHGKYLAVHVRQLAVEPKPQILRRNCRAFLRCLERAYQIAVKDHVHRRAEMKESVFISARWH